MSEPHETPGLVVVGHVCDGCPNVLDDCYPDSLTSCWMKPKPDKGEESNDAQSA